MSRPKSPRISSEKERAGMVCLAFGRKPTRLTKGEEPEATFDQRIESVWYFLLTRAQSFCETLSPRERANFDVEDILIELWAELRVKDEKWVPAKGAYITFAGVIAGRLFSNLRDRSRTVESPSNSTTRIKKFARDQEAGTATERRRIVIDRIRHTKSDYTDVCDSPVEGTESPVDDCIQAEDSAVVIDAMLRGLASLSPYEAVVIGDKFGLWGKCPKSYDQIADSLKLEADNCRAIAARAKKKIRAAIVEGLAEPEVD